MYLKDNPKSEADKVLNKEILHTANLIKNKRLLDYHTGHHNIKGCRHHKNSNFYQYYKNVVSKKIGKSCYRSWCVSLKTFSDYAGEDITFTEITDDFCKNFIEYLRSKMIRNNPINFT